MRRLAIFLALCLSTPLYAAETGSKVYSGEEAAALRCANTVALTAVALSEEGRLPEEEKNVMLGITVLILDRHVTGTWQQKTAAMEVVRDRRDAYQTVQDFQRLAEKCLKQFPIN